MIKPKIIKVSFNREKQILKSVTADIIRNVKISISCNFHIITIRTTYYKHVFMPVVLTSNE